MYVPLLAFALGLMFARTLFMARILSVREFGEFSQALLISSTFCMLACLGLQLMLQRDMPIMIVRGRRVASIVALVQCVIVAVACLLLALATFGFFDSVAGFGRLTLIAGILHGCSQQVFLVATVESRSSGQPVRYAFQNLLRGGLLLLGGVIVAKIWGGALHVVLTECILSATLSASILTNSVRALGIGSSAVVRLAIGRLASIRWHSALALLVVNSVGFVVINSDRWLASQVLDSVRFSAYAFAWTLLMVGQAFQVVINASVFPFLARTFASAGSAAAFRVSFRLSAALLLSCMAMVLPAAFVGRMAIEHWFPGYTAAITLVPLFAFIAAVRIADFWSSYLVIVGRELILVGLNVGSIVFSIAIWILYLTLSDGWRLDLWHVAVLAALLSVSNYVIGAFAAWRFRTGVP